MKYFKKFLLLNKIHLAPKILLSLSSLLLVPFFLLPLSAYAQLIEYEYWFNDDFSGRKTETISGNEATITELDATGLTEGFHQWHLRVKQSVEPPNNEQDWDLIYPYSAITWGGWFFIYKTRTSNCLEYWFDNDYGNSRQIVSNVYNNQFTIYDDIDVNNLSDGIHRFNCRLLPNNTENYEAYTVHSNYFIKGMQLKNTEDTIDVSVTHAKYWVNDNKTLSVTVPVTDLNAADVFTTYMDADTLTSGKYTLNIQIVNSEGQWSFVETAEFEKVGYDQVNMNLVAVMDNDLVNLRWNSIDNIDYYRVFRNESNIATERSTEHPVNFLKVDNPKYGTYTYFVKAYNVSNLTVYQSNEAVITLEQADENEDVNLWGTIQGTVRYSNGTNAEGVKLTLSHNNLVYYTSSDGRFLFQGIPYGTVGTVTATKEEYSFEPWDGIYFTSPNYMNYDISEVHPNRNFSLKAISVHGEGILPPALQNPELQLTSAINGHVIPSFLFDQGALKVNQSLSLGISVKNISDKKWKGTVSLMIDTTGIAGTYDYSFSGKIIVANCEIQLQPTQEMELNFIIPNGIPKPSGEYWFSLTSQQLSGNKKIIASSYEYFNPQNIRIENQDVYKTAQEYMKMVNSKFGTKSFIDALTIATGYETDPAKKNALMRTIMGDISRNIQELLDLKEFLKVEKDVQELLGWIAEFDNYRNANVNDPAIFFQICGTVLEKYGGTLGNIFKIYFDVGNKTATAIQNLSNFLFDQAIGEYEGGEIDIIVKHDRQGILSFLQPKYSASEIASQIDKVELYYKMDSNTENNRVLHQSSQQKRDALTYDIGYSSGGLMTSGKLKISWSNGRISWVPLNSQATEHFRPLTRIDVSFHSQNKGSADNMADKLILILP